MEHDVKIEVKARGAHHEAQLSIDTQSKQVEGGVIYNFSMNSSAQLNMGGDGADATFKHFGDNHELSLHLGRNGRFSGTYREGGGKELEIGIRDGKADLIKGDLSASGSLSIEGDHHSLDLRIDGRGRLSGKIKSKVTKDGSFDLSLDGGAISGIVEHKGQHHETRFALSGNGWQGGASLTNGPTSIQFDVAGGRSRKLSSAQISAARRF
jgi:hypothetical protein